MSVSWLDLLATLVSPAALVLSLATHLDSECVQTVSL